MPTSVRARPKPKLTCSPHAPAPAAARRHARDADQTQETRAGDGAESSPAGPSLLPHPQAQCLMTYCVTTEFSEQSIAWGQAWVNAFAGFPGARRTVTTLSRGMWTSKTKWPGQVESRHDCRPSCRRCATVVDLQRGTGSGRYLANRSGRPSWTLTKKDRRLTVQRRPERPCERCKFLGRR
jgi:hypothetical protein